MPTSMPPLAAIDIGSHSVLLTIATPNPSGRLDPIVDTGTITRLGLGLDAHQLLLEPTRVATTLTALRGFRKLIDTQAAQLVGAVGTAALRRAADREAFLDQAESVLGLRPRVITGQEEAQLAFLAVSSEFSGGGQALVVDIGGGSTQITAGLHGIVQATASLPLGLLALTERFVHHDPATADEIAAMAAHIHIELGAAPATGRQETAIYGVSATFTTLATMLLGLPHAEYARTHGRTLTSTDLTTLVTTMSGRSRAQLLCEAGLHPERVGVIVAGGHLALGVLRQYGARALIVTDRGIRWGLLYRALAERIAPLTPQPGGKGWG